LVDKSLLSAPSASAAATAPAPSTPPRLHMLESVRAFAHEQLVSSGEADRIAARHTSAVAAYWAQADAGALGVPALEWLSLHGVEIDNLRAALRWARDAVPVQGDTPAALSALVANTATLWHRAGLYAEGHSWCNAARSSPALLAGPAPGLAQQQLPGLDLAQATLGMYGNVYPAGEVLACAERAAAGYAACGDAQRQYYALYLVYQSRLRANLRPRRQRCWPRCGRSSSLAGPKC
jgi:hypothetical protein